MKTPKLQQHKIKRLINRYGVEYQFTRKPLDDFKEPSGELETIVTITGIYYETGGQVVLTVGDAASVTSKLQPAILTLLDENAKTLQQNAIVEIQPNSNRFCKVVAVTDIGNVGLFASISLEGVLNGKSL